MVLKGILNAKVKGWHTALHSGAVFVHDQARPTGALSLSVDEKRELRYL